MISFLSETSAGLGAITALLSVLLKRLDGVFLQT
jgi:hypothetical protein